MFNLLQKHSILSDLLTDEMAAGEAFRDGVRRGLQGDAVTAELSRFAPAFCSASAGRRMPPTIRAAF